MIQNWCVEINLRFVESCRLILQVATPWEGGGERNIPSTA